MILILLTYAMVILVIAVVREKGAGSSWLKFSEPACTIHEDGNSTTLKLEELFTRREQSQFLNMRHSNEAAVNGRVKSGLLHRK